MDAHTDAFVATTAFGVPYESVGECAELIARAALEVTSPLIAAKALKDAAEAAHPVGGYVPVTRDGLYDWLNSRADDLEAGESDV